jgi:hypothetical protein
LGDRSVVPLTIQQAVQENIFPLSKQDTNRISAGETGCFLPPAPKKTERLRQF